MRKIIIVLLTVLLPTLSPAEELLVAAASDLAPLEQKIAQSFQQRTGATIRFTFGSSGNLMNQIAHGAPYDVFLAASDRFVRGLAGSHKVSPDTVRVYALGRIAVWAKSGQVRSLEDLKRPEIRRIGLANAETAPYGAAARQALNSAGVWLAVKDKVVYAESIRQTMQFAESGNVDAALVSWSLAKDKGGILLPATLHVAIRQTGAVVASSKQRALALRFLDFLMSPEGQKLLEAGGLARP